MKIWRSKVNDKEGVELRICDGKERIFVRAICTNLIIEKLPGNGKSVFCKESWEEITKRFRNAEIIEVNT